MKKVIVLGVLLTTIVSCSQEVEVKEYEVVDGIIDTLPTTIIIQKDETIEVYKVKDGIRDFLPSKQLEVDRLDLPTEVKTEGIIYYETTYEEGR